MKMYFKYPKSFSMVLSVHSYLITFIKQQIEALRVSTLVYAFKLATVLKQNNQICL